MRSRAWAVLLALACSAPLWGAEDAAGPDIDKLNNRVAELAARGKFSPEMVEAFVKLADARAREALVPGTVDEAFWTWLAAHRSAHRALLVDGWPEYGADRAAAFRNLATLHREFPKAIDHLTDLAVAFALVYARAGDQPISAGWARQARPGPVPGLVESFRWYVENEPRMVYPIAKLPWPVLVYVADNDISIAERQWVLAQYGKMTLSRFSTLRGDLPFGMNHVPEVEKHYSLENIHKIGGVCLDQAYYTSHILKTLGVPAMYVINRVGSTHAWPTWIEMQRDGRLGMPEGDSRIYGGNLWCPMIRGNRHDREVGLLTVAMNQSAGGYLDVCVACRVFSMLAGGEAAKADKAADMLLDALGRRNPYVAEGWRLLASAVADGRLSPQRGQALYGIMAKPFAAYPDLTCEVLTSALTLPAGEGKTAAAADVKRNLATLDQACAQYERCRRPDLVAKMRLQQARCLMASGDAAKALSLCAGAGQVCAADREVIVSFFDGVLALLAGAEHDARRLKYMESTLAVVPQYTGDKKINPAFSHIAEAYAAELEKAGKTNEAQQWRAKAKG